MVQWGWTCLMRTWLTWGDVVMTVDSQVSIWHWSRPLRTKRNMYAKYNQAVSNLPSHCRLSAFLADVDIRLVCIGVCVCGTCLGRDSDIGLVLASFWNHHSTNRRKSFSRGRVILNRYSQCSTLPTGIWNVRPVSITSSQAFAMTSVRLTGEDRKGLTLAGAPLAVASTAEEICETELIQAAKSNPVTPAAK